MTLPVRATCDAVPPAANGPVTLPIDVVNNHVHVRVCHEGRELGFVLDTGAPSSFLDLETARSLGVRFGAPFVIGGAGPGTTRGSSLATPATVTLAGTTIRVGVAQAIAFDSISAYTGRRLEGILGADFISRFVVAIDYRARELRLYDRDAFAYRGAGTVVPISLAAGYVFVGAEVRLSDGTRIADTFVVDVGSSLALSLARPFVDAHRLRERVTPTIDRPSGRGVGGSSHARIGRVASLHIGDAALARPITHLMGDSAGVFSSSRFGAGNIGGDILRRFVTYFDYGRRQMILEPHAGTSEPFETDMSGVSLSMAPGQSSLTAWHVAPGSPAADAGLRAGDIVVAVDGRAVTSATLADVRSRFKRAGERVAFTVKRGDTETVIHVATRRMI